MHSSLPKSASAAVNMNLKTLPSILTYSMILGTPSEYIALNYWVQCRYCFHWWSTWGASTTYFFTSDHVCLKSSTHCHITSETLDPLSSDPYYCTLDHLCLKCSLTMPPKYRTPCHLTCALSIRLIMLCPMNLFHQCLRLWEGYCCCEPRGQRVHCLQQRSLLVFRFVLVCYWPVSCICIVVCVKDVDVLHHAEV